MQIVSKRLVYKGFVSIATRLRQAFALTATRFSLISKAISPKTKSSIYDRNKIRNHLKLNFILSFSHYLLTRKRRQHINPLIS
ncbi:hypothetical protein NCHU2750_15540 [Neorhizobium sp. NCHU2750]|nr:hypothetical protein NCHU2750_15540 [Neorhizobium sp. NCHU2750]